MCLLLFLSCALALIVKDTFTIDKSMVSIKRLILCDDPKGELVYEDSPLLEGFKEVFRTSNVQQSSRGSIELNNKDSVQLVSTRPQISQGILMEYDSTLCTFRCEEWKVSFNKETPLTIDVPGGLKNETKYNNISYTLPKLKNNEKIVVCSCETDKLTIKQVKK